MPENTQQAEAVSRRSVQSHQSQRQMLPIAKLKHGQDNVRLQVAMSSMSADVRLGLMAISYDFSPL